MFLINTIDDVLSGTIKEREHFHFCKWPIFEFMHFSACLESGVQREANFRQDGAGKQEKCPKRAELRTE
ncbi:hypothetical protein JCM9140_3369 [Halalkalibacter wakoensis JCM 9140]|uniref:Uncharacterized protein n=1 Tax=Halalkalibacter wakoensis JCM 9140 TaxID=1236970 RepID=W4Q570_9BACI|nr:hypothetical protein [Halalkalibacter wakoensis]GAE27241.1 hypothetical protein JCM9140_3369 [Halalkalibacter wakoensis JCM 9140]